MTILSSCSSVNQVTEYIDLPFSSNLNFVCDSSVVDLHIDKSSANLITVTLLNPESLFGMKFESDENEIVYFGDIKSDVKLSMSVNKLLLVSFNSANIIKVKYDNESTYVDVATPCGTAELIFDSFSSVPISLEVGDVVMKFSDFNR